MEEPGSVVLLPIRARATAHSWATRATRVRRPTPASRQQPLTPLVDDATTTSSSPRALTCAALTVRPVTVGTCSLRIRVTPSSEIAVFGAGFQASGVLVGTVQPDVDAVDHRKHGTVVGRQVQERNRTYELRCSKQHAILLDGELQAVPSHT